MSGLQSLSGSYPFGGKSIAERNFHHYYGNKGADVTKPIRRRRSTADEAKENNRGQHLDNTHFASGNRTFKVCCIKAKVEPTKRQASKFKREKGRAYAELVTLTNNDYES